jgi:hypothetical protein
LWLIEECEDGVNRQQQWLWQDPGKQPLPHHIQEDSLALSLSRTCWLQKRPRKRKKMHKKWQRMPSREKHAKPQSKR